MESEKVNSIISCPRCKKIFTLAHRVEKLNTTRQCINPNCNARLEISFMPKNPALVAQVTVLDDQNNPGTDTAGEKNEEGNIQIKAAAKGGDTLYKTIDSNGGNGSENSDIAGAHTQDPPYGENMFLQRKGGMFGLGKQEYLLKKGKTIVGRSESDDITITGDDTASRKSVEIEVYNNTYTGYNCRMRVLKALNPVKRNDLPVSVGDTVDLYSGDTITLGHTKFTFIKK